MDRKKLYVEWLNPATGKFTENVPRTLNEFNESPYKGRSANRCECVSAVMVLLRRSRCQKMMEQQSQKDR